MQLFEEQVNMNKRQDKVIQEQAEFILSQVKVNEEKIKVALQQTARIAKLERTVAELQGECNAGDQRSC